MKLFRYSIAIFQNFLRFFGIEIVRSSLLAALKSSYGGTSPFFRVFDAENISPNFKKYLLQNLGTSSSQLCQDLVADYIHSNIGTDRPGFFVEFGATNGIDLSNTAILEKRYGWRGLLAEPAKTWHTNLVKNRTCLIDFRCVSSATDRNIEFWEAEVPELSSIYAWKDYDAWSPSRREGNLYKVETVTLNDLLAEHSVPKIVDYLSIDTEGSEYEILKDFDFAKFSFHFISIEHNYNPNRELICDLLAKNGYLRKFEDLSLWDDWYFSADALRVFN
jgi:FkbM family methyltransferase